MAQAGVSRAARSVNTALGPTDMKLLDEIIEGAVSDTQPIGTVLRKCLVLERQVKNEKFRIWLNNELDGYNNVDELPDYRTINSISRGFFIGYAGSQINDQPLALHVLEEKDRKFVDKVRLTQPAASYLGHPKNQAMGFDIPYLDGGVMRRYVPDFLVRAAQSCARSEGTSRRERQGQGANDP
jgi:AbiTii